MKRTWKERCVKRNQMSGKSNFHIHFCKAWGIRTPLQLTTDHSVRKRKWHNRDALWLWGLKKQPSIERKNVDACHMDHLPLYPASPAATNWSIHAQQSIPFIHSLYGGTFVCPQEPKTKLLLPFPIGGRRASCLSNPIYFF